MKKSTEKQKEAVHYCETWLFIEFDGDIDNSEDCRLFISTYLDDAKLQEMELKCEFEAYIWD